MLRPSLNHGILQLPNDSELHWKKFYELYPAADKLGKKLEYLVGNIEKEGVRPVRGMGMPWCTPQSEGHTVYSRPPSRAPGSARRYSRDSGESIQEW